MNTVKVNILKDIPGYLSGEIVNVAVNLNDIPLDRSWRRRFSDAKIDNCIEVIFETDVTITDSKEEDEKKSKRTGTKKQEKSQ